MMEETGLPAQSCWSSTFPGRSPMSHRIQILSTSIIGMWIRKVTCQDSSLSHSRPRDVLNGVRLNLYRARRTMSGFMHDAGSEYARQTFWVDPRSTPRLARAHAGRGRSWLTSQKPCPHQQDRELAIRRPWSKLRCVCPGLGLKHESQIGPGYGAEKWRSGFQSWSTSLPCDELLDRYRR